MQIKTALQQSRLQTLDAQLLLLHALDRDSNDRAWLIAHAEEFLDQAHCIRFFALCQSRLAGAPVAYLLGRKEFWGLPLTVTPAVLIPRADTEVLVQWALELELPQKARVLDLGTGSGAIALALKYERPHWQICASDLSTEALGIAQNNAQYLGLEIEFLHSHWFTRMHGFFDLIVSNPPYITENDVHLPALQYEPQQALISGLDGLSALNEIAETAPAFLCPESHTKAFLLLEHGFDQAPAVARLLATQGFKDIEQRHDLGGHIRATGGSI